MMIIFIGEHDDKLMDLRVTFTTNPCEHFNFMLSIVNKKGYT
jgi:hypothetical protein